MAQQTNTEATGIVNNNTITTTNPNWITPDALITYNSQVYTTPSETFKNLNKTFDLQMEQEQIDFLDNLYDSGDINNRTIACEMFKSILNGYK